MLNGRICVVASPPGTGTDHSVEELAILEAAARLGVRVVTMRGRLEAGHLNGIKVETPQGYAWRVCLEARSGGLPPAEPSPPPAQATGEIMALRGTIEGLERELAGRNQEVERLTSLLSREQEIVRAMQLALPATSTQLGQFDVESLFFVETVPTSATFGAIGRWLCSLCGACFS